MNGIPVSYKIDTGAQGKVIPFIILKKFYGKPNHQWTKLSTYNNSKIPVLGKCSLTLKQKKYRFDVLFIAVHSKSLPILGLSTSEYLNLIKLFLL